MTSLLFATLLAQQAPASPPRDVASRPAETYTIRGRVTDVGTSQPIRGVEITIHSTQDTGSGARGVLTDEDGRWEFGALTAGDYILNHRKAGYIRVAGVRIYSPVHVSSHFPVRHLELVLARGGVITGRLTDHLGEPAVGAQVQVHRAVDGRVAGTEHQDMTDDRGEFRVFGLAPGEYLLSGEPPQRHDNLAVPDGVQPVRTFYPGAIDPGAAERLFIAEQGTLSDIAFQLQRARLFAVKGRVTTSRGASVMAHVRLQPAESDASWGFFGAPAIDGQFTINNVPSGTYLAVAQARFDKGEEEFGEVPVVVADGDASVSIATRPPVTVRGRIVGAGGPLKDLGMAHVGASPLGPTQFFQGSAGRVREDGTFEFTVFAPRFRVRAWGTTGAVPWRQKEVRWRGELVDAGGLDGTGGDLDGVEVVVLVATARVQGTVSQLREGTVLLVPDEDPGEFGPPWHRAVLTDGRFVSPPLPPGRYIIGAAAAVSPGEITQDLIQALRAQGQALELGDREIRSVEISVIVGPR